MVFEENENRFVQTNISCSVAPVSNDLVVVVVDSEHGNVKATHIALSSCKMLKNLLTVQQHLLHNRSLS